jgi:hypothetical protein
MGLDGISINQLRITREDSSSEMNRVIKNANSEHKIVDGLADSQKVDPDKENEKQNSEFELSEGDKDDIPENEIQQEIIKYDLSDNSKYLLKLDEDSNNILIIEKSSQKIVQSINADELSGFVGYLSNSQGSMINRKF